MSRQIRQIITVHQVKFDSSYLHLPGTQPDWITSQGNFQSQPFTIGQSQWSNWQLTWIIVWKMCFLVAILINNLVEIALLIKQANGNNRHSEVARRFQLIACYIT